MNIHDRVLQVIKPSTDNGHAARNIKNKQNLIIAKQEIEKQLGVKSGNKCTSR